jgi:hypothetical protein
MELGPWNLITSISREMYMQEGVWNRECVDMSLYSDSRSGSYDFKGGFKSGVENGGSSSSSSGFGQTHLKGLVTDLALLVCDMELSTKRVLRTMIPKFERWL